MFKLNFVVGGCFMIVLDKFKVGVYLFFEFWLFILGCILWCILFCMVGWICVVCNLFVVCSLVIRVIGMFVKMGV